MMLVPTRIGPSKIHGIGLFAAERIPRGTHVWRFTPGFDLEIRPEAVSALSEPARMEFERYAYRSKKTGRYVLCFDDARFFNHSPDPNVRSIPCNQGEDICAAARNIDAGEELTCDYRDFENGPPEPYY